MMKKHLLLILVGTILLGGCASSRLETQVVDLSRKVNSLERELNQTKAELASIRDKRTVRLPTGAPTTTQARSNKPPAYTLSPEEKAYEAALSQYKSGDAQGAVDAFSNFLQRYPNAKQRDAALFNLGQAAYTVRDYPRARQALETLVYQPQSGTSNSKAVQLLQRVYRAEGNSAGDNYLGEYLQSLQTPNQTSLPLAPTQSPSNNVAPTSTIGVELAPNVLPATNNGSIFEAPAEPLRPSTLQNF